MKRLMLSAFATWCLVNMSLAQQTIFEASGGKETATYPECIAYYQALDSSSTQIKMRSMGMTDAGKPLHLVLFSRDGSFDPPEWKQKRKTVFLINNGIHPGEPDGIDASMMFMRDLANGKIPLSENVVIAVIPIYNIGGALNRSSWGRVNQDGPAEFGFRGNSQNLDLNRDFTKADSKEAMAFAEIFHLVNPQLFLDTHVSDGADYQHTLTLLTTQYDRLGQENGLWLRNKLEPEIYRNMKEKKIDLIPYVDFEFQLPGKGFTMFDDRPRYSTGYASLFNCIGFMSETHMVKPYKQRVEATYELMITLAGLADHFGQTIIEKQKKDISAAMNRSYYYLHFAPDTLKSSLVEFKGYETDSVFNAVSNRKELIFDHNKPYSSQIRYFNYFKPLDSVKIPEKYIIPFAFSDVIERLKVNGVENTVLEKDSLLSVTETKIESYETSQRPYEKHYRHSKTKTSETIAKIQFYAGDVIVNTNQPAINYIIEMLEPTGDDSFFAWNFFDGFLQQKEWYSTWRWHPLAEKLLLENAELRKRLEEKKRAEPSFAACSECILYWVYQNSPWFEKSFQRYPVYKQY